MGSEIVQVVAERTHPLRRAVLRKGMESRDVVFPEDDVADAFHLAVVVDGSITAVASFSPSPCASRPGADAWQLRGMAVAEEAQGQGFGGAILREAIATIRARHAAVLWCNARDAAQGFYAKLGFVVEGDGFVTKTTGLPHHVMVLDL